MSYPDDCSGSLHVGGRRSGYITAFQGPGANDLPTASPLGPCTGPGGFSSSVSGFINEYLQYTHYLNPVLAVPANNIQGARTDHVDVLVNNAAVGFSERLKQTVLDQWNRVLAINLTGPFLVIQAALPLLRKSHSGSVVNVASVHALGTSTGISAYAASKGGLASLTRALALELAEYGIRVNCILPDAVRTAMLLGGPERSDFDRAAVEKRLERLAERAPLKKIGSPEEIAKAICFLGSPDASFITGQNLIVDGGALARLSTE